LFYIHLTVAHLGELESSQLFSNTVCMDTTIALTTQSVWTLL